MSEEREKYVWLIKTEVRKGVVEAEFLSEALEIWGDDEDEPITDATRYKVMVAMHCF